MQGGCHVPEEVGVCSLTQSIPWGSGMLKGLCGQAWRETGIWDVGMGVKAHFPIPGWEWGEQCPWVWSAGEDSIFSGWARTGWGPNEVWAGFRKIPGGLTIELLPKEREEDGEVDGTLPLLKHGVQLFFRDAYLPWGVPATEVESQWVEGGALEGIWAEWVGEGM